MNEELKNNYDRSIDFWNQALVFSAGDFDGIDKAKDWKDIGSTGLFELMSKAVSGWDNVLDYGCGTGWADVILAKGGAGRIKAVDVAQSAVESAKLYAAAFDSADAVSYEAVDVNWLGAQPKATYDYALCCNVLDVIPMEVAEGIIADLSKVCKKGAKVLVTLNPFFTEEMRNRDGVTYEAPYMYVNGILRVNNHTDEEWSDIFSRYFTIDKLEHFKWDAEQVERRRLFHLQK